MNDRPPSREASHSDGSRLYTLSEIAAETGIPLTDLARYRERLGRRLPAEERGDRRRYPAAAVEVFRSYHRRGNGDGQRESDGEEGMGRRRLLSLSAQRQRRQDEQRKRAAEPVVDPGPPDPMSTAMEALSGIGHTPRETEGKEKPAPRKPDAATGAEASPPEMAPAKSAPPEPARPKPAPPEAPRPETVADAEEEPERDEAAARTAPTVVRRPENVVERRTPARPSRPVYTLQEVHEKTGIPYARLALYAAAHADQIPSVGERRSPAYMREGMEAFCRLHALKEPGWEMPDLGPEAGWDDATGLAARLEVLETNQSLLAGQLRGTVLSLRKTWNGEATWES